MKDVRELEVYACIDGFPNYLVSSHGRVITIRKYNNGKYERCFKERKQQINYKGYKIIRLYNKGKYKTFSVHRLVAQAFISNPDNKPQVNHIDENKQNNHVYNLEWMNNEENARYGTRGKRIGDKHKRKIVGVNNKGEKIIYNSLKDAEKDGFVYQAISGVCRGNRKSHKGYTWHYLDDNKKDHLD